MGEAELLETADGVGPGTEIDWTEDAHDWRNPRSPEYRLRYRTEGGRAYLEVLTLLWGERNLEDETLERSSRILDSLLLQRPWEDWWPACQCLAREEGPGFASFDFRPLSLPFPSVRLHLHRVPASTSEVYRLRSRFSGDTTGWNEVSVFRSLDSGLWLRERWEGLRLERRLPLRLFAWLHLQTMAGRLPFPFRNRTGFPGLVAAFGREIREA